MPDPGLRQLKRAVRPLLTPHIEWMSLAGFFVGWLVVAQVVFSLARRQRAMDALLIVIAIVLVGRVFVGGSTLEFAELAAIVLLLPAAGAVQPPRRRRRVRRWSPCCSACGSRGPRVRTLVERARPVDVPTCRHCARCCCVTSPPPPLLANKAFSYLALGWLLAGAGLVPHVAAGMTVLFVLLLTMLQLGAPRARLRLGRPADRAAWRAWIVARWMPRK